MIKELAAVFLVEGNFGCQKTDRCMSSQAVSIRMLVLGKPVEL